MSRIEEILNERFVYSVWDGESQVNGANREEMEELGMPFPDGVSFLIRDTMIGRFVYFQTFDPDLSGYQPMSEERAAEVGGEIRAQLVNEALQNIED